MSRRASKISVIPGDPEAPHHEGVLFVQGIPQSTKLAFKRKCMDEGETMRDVIIQLMRSYVDNSRSSKQA